MFVCLISVLRMCVHLLDLAYVTKSDIEKAPKIPKIALLLLCEKAMTLHLLKNDIFTFLLLLILFCWKDFDIDSIISSS